MLKKTGMKWLKILHLCAACCWLGGAAAMVTLNLNNGAAEDMLYGLNTASHLVDIWVVVICGATGCLATGLLFALLTPWGFFRHHWLTVKWILTALCILSGTFFLGAWEGEMLELSRTLGVSALGDSAYLAVKANHLALSVVQIASLIFMVAISVIRPWGSRSGRSRKA